MSTISVSADAIIEAPAGIVLEVIRDFRTHHPNILPPAFSNFRVLEGGYGDGSVLAFTTTLGGRAIEGSTIVREPEPGVVREYIIGRDMVTTFRVVPNVAGSYVTIETVWTPLGGVQGLLERAFVPRLLRNVYRQELELLAGYAAWIAEGRVVAGPARAFAPA